MGFECALMRGTEETLGPAGWWRHAGFGCRHRLWVTTAGRGVLGARQLGSVDGRVAENVKRAEASVVECAPTRRTAATDDRR
jgi:hypothetical protein